MVHYVCDVFQTGLSVCTTLGYSLIVVISVNIYVLQADPLLFPCSPSQNTIIWLLYYSLGDLACICLYIVPLPAFLSHLQAQG